MERSHFEGVLSQVEHPIIDRVLYHEVSDWKPFPDRACGHFDNRSRHLWPDVSVESYWQHWQLFKASHHASYFHGGEIFVAYVAREGLEGNKLDPAQIESLKLAEMGIALTLTAGRILDVVK